MPQEGLASGTTFEGGAVQNFAEMRSDDLRVRQDCGDSLYRGVLTCLIPFTWHETPPKNITRFFEGVYGRYDVKSQVDLR
jgi:hypothetical protein